MSQQQQKQQHPQQHQLQSSTRAPSPQMILSPVPNIDNYTYYSNGTIPYHNFNLDLIQSTQPQAHHQTQTLDTKVPIVTSKIHQTYNPNNSSTIVDLESQRITYARSIGPQPEPILDDPYLAYQNNHYYQFNRAPATYLNHPTAYYTPRPSSNILPPRPYSSQNGYSNYTYQHNYNNQNGYNTHNNPSSYSNQIYYSLPPQTKQMSVQQTITPGPRLVWLLFMHRHGDRAPLNMAPRDKYNNISYWPEGFGNLNNAGRLRMFKLGQFIRRRYENFLTDNLREVYSRSSDVDRCIESSHAVLAGIYKPSKQFEWNKELHWIPAPVHSVPPPEDYLLNEGGRKFLVEFINEIHLIQNSDAVKKLYEESVKERELLERELGYEYDMFYKFKCTYSTLDIEERNGLTMPAWYTPELKQKLYRFAGIAFGLAGGGTEKMKKIRCSHLLEDIINRIEMASISGPSLINQIDFEQPIRRKIVHYSTHDSIMAAFLEALNINTPMPVPPGFGATFFIELYVDLNEQGLPVSEKYIKLFYMDDTESEKPIEKKLPNCRLNEKGQLTLNNFKKYVANLLPSNTTSNM